MTKAVPLTCTGHSRPITHLAFSDELHAKNCAYTLVSGCKSGQPIVRNGVTGDWLGTFLGHEGAIWCTKITPNGRYVATASADFSAFVWNAQTGEAIAQLPHNHIVRSVDFEPNFNLQTGNCRIISGSQDKTLRIWNVKSIEAEIEWTLDEPIRSVLWLSADTVISADFAGYVQWWKLSPKLECIRKIKFEAMPGQITISCGCIVIAAGNSAKVLKAASGEQIKNFLFDYKVSCACITKDRTRVLTGSLTDTWIRVYSFDDETLIDTFKGHHGPVHHIECSPDSRLAASGSDDGTVRIWKLDPGAFGLWM